MMRKLKEINTTDPNEEERSLLRASTDKDRCKDLVDRKM